MTTADMTDDGAQTPNPMQEYGSAEELSDAVGTDIFIRVCPQVVSNRPQK